ncbi:phage holin family protein [Patescibacteria group bacterium]|nr:phage holin family protein [Patescibacteria group bacterium]
MTECIALFGTSQIQTIVLLLMADVVLGIAAALMKKEFALSKVAIFMKKPVLGYVFGFAVIGMVAQALPALAIIETVVFVLIVLALLGSISKNLGKLGLPVPAILK